jgi:hypothetical protein
VWVHEFGRRHEIADLQREPTLSTPPEHVVDADPLSRFPGNIEQ